MTLRLIHNSQKDHNDPKRISCDRQILRALLERPKGLTVDHLNNRIKEYSLYEINGTLHALLTLEIIAVTNKRFWIRDKQESLAIEQGRK